MITYTVHSTPQIEHQQQDGCLGPRRSFLRHRNIDDVID